MNISPLVLMEEQDKGEQVVVLGVVGEDVVLDAVEAKWSVWAARRKGNVTDGDGEPADMPS